MAKNSMILIFGFIILFITHMVNSQPLGCPLPPELAGKLHVDSAAIESASTDYGNIVHTKPRAVLFPTSVQDIASLINASFSCSTPFAISVKGNGHCTHGQAMAYNGVVIDMKALRDNKKGFGIVISKQPLYVDVGGEQLWADVLNATVAEGFAPVSWTDFLGLTIGGTLSNAGASGQTFRFGPQISNVYELDVITGKGELVTCSSKNNSDLLYGVLGGLGQFGVITRARITLGPAFKTVLWAQTLYTNFTEFARDQERYIAANEDGRGGGMRYLEGAILLDNGTPNTWRTSFFPPSDLPKITSLVKQYGIIYCLEAAQSLDGFPPHDEMDDFIKSLASSSVYFYQKKVSYVDFLNRVEISPDEQSRAHPWLNLFLPKSRISDFNSGVLRDIVLRRNITTGPVLFTPMIRSKWDERMSAVIPDEEDILDDDIFYTAGFLHSSGTQDWRVYDDQNKAVLEFCDKAGIAIKQYLPHFATVEEWIRQFGSKWHNFRRKKALFDPKMILAPGPGIFST